MNKKLKIGIRAHDLDNAPFNNTYILVKELKKIGLNNIQLVFKKCFKNFKTDFSQIDEISKVLKDNNINVIMLGAYFNMVHSNTEKKESDIVYFKECLKIANKFDINVVGSETGSYNDDSWTYNPKNHTENAFLEVKEVVRELKEFGKIYNSEIICEGAYNHVINNVSLLKRLVDELNLNYVTIDIFNYLNINNYLEHEKIFDQAILLLRDKIRIFHIKDFIIRDNKLIQVGIGEGLMNYSYIIPKIIENCPNATLVLEGVTKDKIIPSIDYLRSFESERKQ